MTAVAEAPVAPRTAQFRPPKLQVPFSAADMQNVIRGARRVLDEVGVQCGEPEIRRLLASLPGARVSEDRVYFGDAVVDGILADSKLPETEAKAPQPREKLKIGAGFCCLQIADVKTGRVRASTSAEAARAVRLLEGLGATVAVAPVASGDVPPEMANLAGLRTVLKHSRQGSSLTNQPVPEQIETAIEMGAAAGHEPRAFIMAMISPLRYETKGIAYFMKHRDRKGIRLSLSGSMPCTGSTSPLHLPGTLIQSLAEALAMAACERALGIPGTVSNVRCDPCDFRTGNYVIASPEYHLLDMASRALFREITGVVRTAGSFRSMAKFPDAQATAERCFSVLFQALQGARHFGATGQLSMDELFSPEQAVIDCEIVRNVERIVSGMEWHDETAEVSAVDEAVEMIRRGAQTGHYLDSDETLANCRDAFYRSDLFGYEKLQAWVAHGSRSVIERAGERAEAVVQQMPECMLSAEKAREVDRIFDRACRG